MDLRELKPVESAERLETIDLLRGVAILGILLVNLQMYFLPLYQSMAGARPGLSALDRAVDAAIHVLAQGKFYSMFSFLFGLGMAIQLERATRRGASFPRFFARRMGGLLAIGLVHAVLLWYGDILVLYALLGFLAMPFRRLPPRALATWIVVLVLIPLALVAGICVTMEMLRHVPAAWSTIESDLVAARAENAALLDRALFVYARGSFAEILAMRLDQLRAVYESVPFLVAPQILGLVLAGFAAGRLRLLHDVARSAPLVRRALPWLAAAGLALSTLSLVAMHAMDPIVPSWWMLLHNAAFLLGGPTLCFAYVAGLALLVQRPRWRARLRPLTFVGRMALTSYLTHTVVFTTLANGYGFGLYGSIRPALGLAMTLAMFAIQIPLSRFWLARFRFGPVEWLWRSLTYGSPQPMRRAA